MPKPKANESRKDFMMRCIPMVIKEGKSREQAIAQCSATYANKDKYANEGDEILAAIITGLIILLLLVTMEMIL